MQSGKAQAFIFLLLIVSGITVAQPANDSCHSAQELCVEDYLLGNNNNATAEVCPGCSDGADTAGLFCFELTKTVWYKFLTNNLGGAVLVTIDNIRCDTVGGLGDGLDAIIVFAPVPCDESTYTSVSNCASSNNVLILSAPNLMANTEYFLMINGRLGTQNLGAECNYYIEISGPAVELADAGPDLFLELTESPFVTIQGTAYGTVNWTPASSLDDPTSATPDASPGTTTTYYMQATSASCTQVDAMTVTVTVEGVEDLAIVPNNIFSPNGDGINDSWGIINIDKFPDNKVSVFDRWGQRIYNTEGYSSNNEWDGTFTGLKIPTATYYYIIELQINEEETLIKQGDVTIVY